MENKNQNFNPKEYMDSLRDLGNEFINAIFLTLDDFRNEFLNQLKQENDRAEGLIWALKRENDRQEELTSMMKRENELLESLLGSIHNENNRAEEISERNRYM